MAGGAGAGVPVLGLDTDIIGGDQALSSIIRRITWDIRLTRASRGNIGPVLLPRTHRLIGTVRI